MLKPFSTVCVVTVAPQLSSKDDIEYFNLTRTEKRDDLRAFFVSMEDAKELLKEYNKDNPKAAYLAVETIKVLDEYEKLEIE